MSTLQHSSAMVGRARELRDAGWQVRRIRDLLAREFDGHAPSVNTVWCWVEPDAALRQAAAKRRLDRRDRAATASFSFPGRRSPVWKLGRMHALRAAGLSCVKIAAVMALDFGDDLDPREVRRALETEQPPAKLELVA